MYMEQGREKGRTEGEIDQARSILLRQMRRRFAFQVVRRA